MFWSLSLPRLMRGANTLGSAPLCATTEGVLLVGLSMTRGQGSDGASGKATPSWGRFSVVSAPCLPAGFSGEKKGNTFEQVQGVINKLEHLKEVVGHHMDEVALAMPKDAWYTAYLKKKVENGEEF
mgnify:CR=1 FL=1